MRFVKNKTFLIAIILLLCPLCLRGQQGMSASEQEKEYKVKAAFVYNFMKFVEWEGMSIEGFKDKKEIILAVVGDDPFNGGLDALKSKTIAEKQISLEYFEYAALADQSQTDRLARCNVVFISGSEKDHYSDIVSKVNKTSVLTIGDEKTFAVSGGIIAFDIESGKVCFDINLNAAKNNGVKINVKLLKLARAVHKE